MLSRMAPSSPPAMRTLHLLKIPDILLANDTDNPGRFHMAKGPAQSGDGRHLQVDQSGQQHDPRLQRPVDRNRREYSDPGHYSGDAKPSAKRSRYRLCIAIAL